MDFEQALTYELQAITGLSGQVFPKKQKKISNLLLSCISLAKASQSWR